MVAERVAARDERIAVWQGAVRAAVEEVGNALTTIDRERAHNAALRRAARGYADALSVAQSLYQAGLAAFLDVLDAQRSLSTVRDSVALSDVALAKGAVALFKALGGGWDDGRVPSAQAARTPAAPDGPARHRDDLPAGSALHDGHPPLRRTP